METRGQLSGWAHWTTYYSPTVKHVTLHLLPVGTTIHTVSSYMCWSKQRDRKWRNGVWFNMKSAYCPFLKRKWERIIWFTRLYIYIFLTSLLFSYLGAQTWYGWDRHHVLTLTGGEPTTLCIHTLMDKKERERKNICECWRGVANSRASNQQASLNAAKEEDWGKLWTKRWRSNLEIPGF